MANRRMFSKNIVDSDAFLDMPASSQILYFHLVMRADDDGFVGSPKKIMRMINVSEDDYKILIAKRFILEFPEGICVIKHWWVHNTMMKDRYHLTAYQEQLKTLKIKENGAYTEACYQDVNKMLPQIKLNETKLNKTNNATKVASPTLKVKEDTTPMTCAEFVEWCRKSPQKHIQIIGEWAEAEQPNNQTYGEWQSFIKRNLRPAHELKAYGVEKIEKAYNRMLKDVERKENGKKVGFITKYSLETVGKYIDQV